MKYLATLIPTLLLLMGCNDKAKDTLVKIKTTFGDMTVLLFDETPKHKQNFLALAESGSYDSTIFHRVINGFMIQAGDIYRKDGIDEPAEDRIDAEIREQFYHKKGALAAARQGDQINPAKKSSGAQFYIVQGRVWTERELTTDVNKLQQGLGQLMQQPQYDTIREKFVALQQAGKFEEMSNLSLEYKSFVEENLGVNLTRDMDPDRLAVYTTSGGVPHLDGEYTVFGQVVEGMDVIDKIASLQTNRDDRPLEDSFLSMEVMELPKAKITEQYGYDYPETKE